MELTVYVVDVDAGGVFVGGGGVGSAWMVHWVLKY